MVIRRKDAVTEASPMMKSVEAKKAKDEAQAAANAPRAEAQEVETEAAEEPASEE
jgi:small subunit ribosomal protein S6